MRAFKRSVSLAMLLAAAGSASAGQPAKVIYSTITSSPTSDIPGMPGFKFISFDRPNPSQNGRRWITVASASTGDTATDNVLLVGHDDAGVIAVQEGVTEIEAGRTSANLTLDRRCSIRDDGMWAYTLDLSGSTADDKVVVRGMGTGFSILFREGNSAPGIAGASFGSSINEAQILDSGTVSVRTTLTGLTTATDGALLADTGSIKLAQEGDIPTAQLFAPNQTYTSFGGNSFTQSNDGSTWTAIATLSGPAGTNSIAIRNNAVLVQEGAVISGLGSPVHTIYISPTIGGNNDAFVSGWTTAGGSETFVTRNGVLLAKANDAIVGGLPGEIWDTTAWDTTSGKGFFINTSDEAGNYVLGAFTNAGWIVDTRTGENVVFQYNGSTVLLRGGDPIDVNGNGLADDDAFYYIPLSALAGASLGNKVSDAWLSADGYFYKVIDLRNGAGDDLGDALIRIQIPSEACTADFNDSGSVTADDIFAFLDAWFTQNGQSGPALSADFNGSLSVTADDIFAFLDAWFAQNGNCS